MKKLFLFLFSKAFWLNLLIAAVISAVGIYFFLNFLESYTRHGEYVDVPDFKGFHKTELKNFVADKPITFEVIDSIYDIDQPRGVVIDQNPAAGDSVKPGRKIYLTINSVLPPMVRVPEIRDMTLRSAVGRLNAYGLKVGEIIAVPSECNNCVVDVELEGESLESGSMVKEGTVIDLITGAGMSSENIPLPNLLGMALPEASRTLKLNGLNTGLIEYDSTVISGDDTAAAQVFQQYPEPTHDAEIQIGSSIDIQLTIDSNKLEEFLLPTQQMPDSSILGNDTIL